MKIALIADTHDHLERLAAALEVFTQSGAQALIHAGDFVAPFTARQLSSFDGPIWSVFGNCDGEHRGLTDILKKSVSKPPIAFELAGRRFVLAHKESQITDALLSQAQVAVVGHTHQTSQAHIGQTLLINPGECCGRITGQATVALLDSQDLSVEVITLP